MLKMVSRKFSRYWPGGTSATDVKFFVISDPDQTYYIQASLTLSAAEAVDLLKTTMLLLVLLPLQEVLLPDSQAIILLAAWCRN